MIQHSVHRAGHAGSAPSGRRALRTGVLCAALVCAACSLQTADAAPPQAAGGAPAQEHAPSAHGDAAPGGAGHADEGRPPLLSFDPGTAVWSIVVFVGLLIVLRAIAWKPILAGLHAREKFIHDTIENARRERTESERLLKQYQAQIDRAREEATAIVEEGKRDAEVVRRRIMEEARVEAAATLERAKREIAIARDDAVQAVYAQSIEVATQIAAKLIRRQLTPADQRTLLQEAIAEVGELAERAAP